MRCAVREVAKHFPTAIISGRSRDKVNHTRVLIHDEIKYEIDFFFYLLKSVCYDDQVYGFVKLDEIYYAGSHGMDIMGPPSHVNSYDNKFQTNTMDKKVLFFF